MLCLVQGLLRDIELLRKPCGLAFQLLDMGFGLPDLIRGHAEIRRKFIHLGCRLLFCKAFLQKWPHQSRGLVKVLDAVERDAIKPAEKRFG